MEGKYAVPNKRAESSFEGSLGVLEATPFCTVNLPFLVR